MAGRHGSGSSPDALAAGGHWIHSRRAVLAGSGFLPTGMRLDPDELWLGAI